MTIEPAARLSPFGTAFVLGATAAQPAYTGGIEVCEMASPDLGLALPVGS